MTDLAQSGRTVIFVSHNVESVRRLCSRIVFLESSKIKFDGPTNKAMDLYLHTGTTSKRQVVFPEKKGLEINIRKIWLTNEKGEFASTCQIHESPNIQLELAVASKELKRVEVSLQITNSSGINLIFSSLSQCNNNNFYEFKKGVYQATMSIDANLLLPDTYSIAITTHFRGDRRIELIENAFTFEITESNSGMAPYGRAAKTLTALIGGSSWKIIPRK
jgi:lipopolysaccharide transport system ATP-binding protein